MHQGRIIEEFVEHKMHDASVLCIFVRQMKMWANSVVHTCIPMFVINIDNAYKLVLCYDGMLC